MEYLGRPAGLSGARDAHQAKRLLVERRRADRELRHLSADLFHVHRGRVGLALPNQALDELQSRRQVARREVHDPFQVASLLRARGSIPGSGGGAGQLCQGVERP